MKHWEDRALKAELALSESLAREGAMREDAERYRWIRKNHYSTGHTSTMQGLPTDVEHFGFDAADCAEDLDAAIDSAIATKEGKS